MNTKKVKKAVIPVAGLGTRFLPYTKAIPKEMLPIINIPTIQYIVDEAIQSGIEEILLITSQGKDSIIDHFDRDLYLEEQLFRKGKGHVAEDIKDISKAKIFTVRQYEQKGLGHAVLNAKSFINDEPFALLLGDDVIYNPKENKPALKQLIDVYEKFGGSVLGVQEVDKNLVSSYGVIDPEEEVEEGTWKLKGLVEKPEINDAPSNFTIMGRYVLSPSVFKELSKKFVDPNTNEIQITDSILRMMKKEEVFAHRFEGERYDMGSVLGFLEANIKTALRDRNLREKVIKMVRESIDKSK